MTRRIDPDDLLVLLEVARSGRLVGAARRLGVNHTTVARRLTGLEKALGLRLIVQGRDGWELTPDGRRAVVAAETVEAALEGLCSPPGSTGLTGTVRVGAPDGYGIHYAVPALTELVERHPELQWELTTATQRLRHARTGLDIDIVVGRPVVSRATTLLLARYELGLYATRTYLRRAGEPRRLADLADHRLCYYVESALTVDDLDEAAHRLPRPATSLRSTSVFAHVRTTALSAGIGLLPDYLAATEPGLVRVLPEAFTHPASYWAVVREESYRSPAVHAVVDALRRASGTPDPD